jgi:nitrite reductase/ring-hydroxylating ferredoxin subunit
LNVEKPSQHEKSVKVGRVTDFPLNRARKVKIFDEEVAIWNVEGKFYAIANVCVHQHVSVLHEAILDGKTITCPMHGWCYSLETGKAITGNGKIRVYDVWLFGSELFVKLPPEG